MSTDIKKVLSEVRNLNMSGKRKEALELISKFKKEHCIKSVDIDLEESFLLYHIVADNKFRPNTKNNLLKAYRISKKIYSDNKNSKKQRLNAGLFLAQIYLFLGQNEEALKQARKNYLIRPNSLTANRLADIYNRLDRKKYAIRWYKKSIDLCKKNKEKICWSEIDLAFLMLKIDRNTNSLKNLDKTIKLVKKNIKDPAERKSIIKNIQNKIKEEGLA